MHKRTSRKIHRKKDALAARALMLKKSWLLAAAMFGAKLSPIDLQIPNYFQWARRELIKQVDDLEGDFFDALKNIIRNPNKKIRDVAARWMAEAFDRWQKEGGGIFTLCTAQQFEMKVGRLKSRQLIEVPPYAELLLQGWSGMALRHPEYMLARDLEALYTLYLDCEDLLRNVDWSDPPEWAKYGSENGQALARAVIQTCFNLLESFVSGVGRAHVMENPGLDSSVKRTLLNNTKPLKTRVIAIPEAVLGKSAGVSVATGPYATLFGPIKQRRDSFVHCEPGPQQSSRGYIKEAMFHEVSPETVHKAVDCTLQIIRHLWKELNQTSGPRWLKLNAGDFTIQTRNLRLSPSADRGPSKLMEE